MQRNVDHKIFFVNVVFSETVVLEINSLSFYLINFTLVSILVYKVNIIFIFHGSDNSIWSNIALYFFHNGV